jgi:hypothetical protein
MLRHSRWPSLGSSRWLPVWPAVATLALLTATPPGARADIDFKFSGYLSSDIRFRVLAAERPPPTPQPTQWTLLKNGVSRNENRIRAALTAKLGSKVKAVADVEMVTWGFSDLSNIDSSTLRPYVDPYYFEFHAAYIDINNLFGSVIPRFDLRIGRQTVPWGSADKFNPISNLNTLDLSDPLMFGRALANNMIRADWNPIGDLNFTAVLVPVFRPAQLPRTAPLALLDPLRPAPIADQDVRAALDRERAIYVPAIDPATGLETRPASGTLTITTDVLAPEITAANMQAGFRTAWKLLDQDMGLSYYHGRFGVPVPAWSISTGGLFSNLTKTAVVYPRMDVIGVEMAGSILKLGGIGYWIEAAVYLPGEVTLSLYDAITAMDPNSPRPMEYLFDPACGTVCRRYQPVGSTSAAKPVVIEKTPFVKATLGFDYTIAQRVYVNVQYVHGFIDEFGAGRAARPRRNAIDLAESPRVESRIGDYIVAGVDIKALREALLFRLFGVFKLPTVDLASRLWDDWAPTGVLFPQIIWRVFDGTELMIGGFIMLGDRSTKFGDPAAGGSEIFAKAKVSF